MTQSSNIDLYLPNRIDNVEVDTTLASNFTKIDAKIGDHTTQLTDIVTNIVYLERFKRQSGETDDTGRFQRAIDSFTGNIAGTILIPNDIRISSQVTCNKTGLRLVGISNRKSRIICTHGGIGLFIKPLYNGAVYTSISYCKFFTENIAIVAEGAATVNGTGLWLQWIYASSFHNLYTSGFAKHIVLKGAHLNTFYNLYQGNKDSAEQTIDIHNRGVGLSADGTLEAGETTSNNNHIIGGWINNCSLDFTNMPGTITEKIDIEPASNSIIAGDNAVFRDSRFERFDYYVVNGNHYPPFPWFVVGNNCKFENNEYYQSGASYTFENPMFKINGDLNKIEIPNHIPFNTGLISFSDTAKGNIIEYNGIFEDYQNSGNNVDFKQEQTSIKHNSNQNRIIYKDNVKGTITDVVGSHLKAQGEFTNRNSRNTDLVNNTDYSYDGLTSAAVDIPLPIGRTAGSLAFTKLTLNSSSGNRRMLLATPNAQTAPVAGVYTLTATVYVPTASSTVLKIGATLSTLNEISARDKWMTVRSRVYLNAGEQIIPTFQMLGITGDVFYVGEISVCDGNTSVYIPNNTYGSVSASF